MKERKVRRHDIYQGDFIDVYIDDVLLDNGIESKRIVVEHVGASSILPITKDQEVILVKQYRYAIQDYTLEIPAGKKDFKAEDGLACAIREMEEETGYASDHIQKITEIYSAIGFSNEVVEIYVAYEAYPLLESKNGDEDEFIEIVKMPLREAIELVKTGIIKDAKTVVSILSLS
ncbi:MAG: NUDIX hydrolase [Candidatus Izemoplasmataceae bacterium]|uniref:NUDIX hydrolase n=1 Tax=Liberiplasma polymorphum TaxID=3374570 RepID=UPI0037737FDC